MVARVYLCLHIAHNDVFEARVDGVRASLDTSSKLRAFSLANYKRNVSLWVVVCMGTVYLDCIMLYSITRVIEA